MKTMMADQLLSTVKRHWLGLLATVVLTGVLFGAFWWPTLVHTAIHLAAPAPDPVTAAWAKAKAAGSYQFTSDVLQKTLPVASITNVGRTSHTDAFHLEGQNDLRNQKLELTLWNQGGSVLNAASGVSIRSEGGKTFTRRGGYSANSAEPWQATDNQIDAFAPQGDFLGYLAAIRNVSAGVPEMRNGIRFVRYTFDIDGPLFATYMHEQMVAALRAKGELPSGVQLEPPAYYRDMTGSGELWVGANGLPLRQILNLRFPEQQDERVEASVTVDFAQYGAEQTALLTLLRTGQWQGAWLVLPQRLPDFTALWLALLGSALTLAVLVYRRRRAVQVALVVAVIFAEVAGPLLTTFTQVRFFDTQRAKAAAQQEQQAADQSQRTLQTKVSSAPEFNPHQNPLEDQEQKWETARLGDYEIGNQAPTLSLSQSSNLQTVDPGADTDKDGLTDFTEVRIGTSEVISDTDDDGLLDNLEVNGFTLGGQTWHTNPDATDSNNDGLSDIVEWGIDSNTGLPQATPRDTDSDGLPDLFDPDNDNDGVPDRSDTAPFAKGATTYTDADPLQFSVNNLAANKPTFVDFQIRPQDPKNLWFAYNVLDWPQDSDGQMRDVDGKTYADVAAAAGRTADASESNGDMKLVPMLEIRIPITSANLPSQAELTPFNISVNDFTADGATKVAYVPLTLVIDPLTGERVAFSGQMRYKPTGSWSMPHSVRLAWVVQALNDLPCDHEAAEAAAQGCQSDGYIHNQPIMLHTYYDNWSLTGLSVREDHGTSMAVIYEDPAVDLDQKDDAPLWALTTALDEHFLKARDANHDSVRDLKISDMPARFDRDNNPSDDQRFSIPNILQVVTGGSYPTADEAAMTTAMTTTTSILNNAFKAPVQADNRIQPLLLFATENNLRAVGLDQVVGNEGYATQSGATINLNLAPTAATALSVTVEASLKWMAYCGANGTNVTWRPCTSDEVADTIEARYANAPSLPGDTDPAEVPGRMMLALSYYFTLAGGYQKQVQEGTAIASSRYSLEGESDTTTRIRLAMQSVGPLPQIVTLALIHISLSNPKAGVTVQIKETLEKLGETYYSAKKDYVQLGVNGAGDQTAVTKATIKAVKLQIDATIRIKFARYAAGAVVGSALMLLTTVLSHNPDFNTSTRAVLGTIGAAITIGGAIYIPAATASDLYKWKLFQFQNGDIKTKPTLAKTLSNNLLRNATRTTAFNVGLVVNIALIWGFFAYAAGTSGYAAGSPEMNKAAAEAIASTVVTVLIAALSMSFIGTIIVGIISVIDTILNLICELGVDQLRIQGSVYGGACFSITTTATKVLAYFLYNYEPMIDTSRSDLMVAGEPHVTLADPNKGYVPSNTLTLTLPVTTTIVHKSPDPANGLLINAYLWLYSPDNLRSSTFKYGLSADAPSALPVDLNQMPGAWQDVREDHKYVLTPMYRGVATTDPAPLSGLELTQGLNSTVPFSLTMNFAIPAYECWLIPIPYGFIIIPTPVCRARELENANTMPFTMLKYDVLPNTLAEFLALGAKPNGGLGQSWDARLPALRDADGDGLTGPLYQGLDPNDTTWDTDGDGLSDRFELEQRTAGAGYAPLLRDTDGDGLTDKQEMELGTDPAVADTDNDGLIDGVEVRHQVYDVNGAQGAPLTNTWAGGWQVTINSTPTRTVWVSSDPFNADSDQDGVSDQAEKELAANANPTLRIDNQGVPYNPNVPNTTPLAVFTESDAFNGYVRPGQSFEYTTTVVANVPVVPGVLNITSTGVLNSASNPLALDFSVSPTVTRSISLTVQNGVASQNFALGSTVNTRLPDTGAAKWLWSTATTPAGLGVFAGRLARRIAAAPLPNRPDTYRLTALASTSPGSGSTGGPGDIWSYTLPLNAARSLDTDGVGATTIRGVTSPDVACNLSGVCMAVWEERPSGGVNSDLLGVLIQPNGIVNTATFTIASSAADNSGNSNAKVTSDGVNFLVAWQCLLAIIVNTPTGNTYNFQTNLMTRLYSGQGAALTPVTELANEKVEATSLNTPTVSLLNASRYRHNQLALAWIGSRYRLLRWFDFGGATMADDFIFKENGVNANWRNVTWRDIDVNGALVAGSKSRIYIQSTLDDTASHSLFYDPKYHYVIVAHSDSGEANFQVYMPPETAISGLLPLATSNAANVVAAYYAQTSSYLFGWTDTASHSFVYKAYDSSTLDTLGEPSTQQLTWSVPASSALGTALACSSAASTPMLDLRFEELPDAATFIDSSGFDNTATCSGATCPAAGVTGAPNAPLSDYALRFDGVDDRLTINTALANSFTAALWMKSAPNANNDTLLVEQGVQTPNGWTFYLGAGAIHLLIGTNQFLDSFSPRVDDNQWHFIAATRNGSTGATALYVDGVQIKTGTATTSALTALDTLMIGGDRVGKRSFNGLLDHLQLFPVALDASTIQAIYNRSFQAPCVAAAVATDGTTFPWSSIQVQPQDTRGGRLSAGSGLTLTVDSVAPVATVTSVANNQVLGPDQIIGGAASDQGSGIGKVEVSINNGAWQLANGAHTWTYSLAGLTGAVGLQVRATDLVGNVGAASAAVIVTIDNTPPQVTINAPATTLKPTKTAGGQWQVPLTGIANDDTGLNSNALWVKLTQASGVGLAQSQQAATITGNTWSLTYLLDPSLFDPTGSYTVTAQVDDTVGNRAVAAPQVVRLDAAGPVATLNASDATRTVITQTLTIGGVITDTNSIVGLDKVEIAFTPVEQIAALPGNSSTTQAEAQLNRIWLPVTLAQRGAGVATTTWSFAVPTGLENVYQIDLRGTDLLDNVSSSANLWRGLIDTSDPRVAISTTATGASYFDTGSQQTLYEVRFVCAAVDRNLREDSFTCPGNALQPPVRSFTNDPSLQALFPDLTIRSGLANTYTLWSPTTTPTATVRACDGFGRCAQTSTAELVEAAGVTALPVPGAPAAIIVNPTNGSFVAAGNTLTVTIAAEAGALLKTVTLSLDNQVVQTLDFAQSDTVTRTLRTLGVSNVSEGQHTLVAQATAWDAASQSTLYPVTFTLDQNVPLLTIDPTTLTLADTWQPASGVLRFKGNASDSVGLAAVQLREGNNGFADATFANGAWRVALPVIDPEGRTLTITARAIDRAGRVTEVTQQLATDLSAPDAPDTAISSGPAELTPAHSAQFGFTGSATAIAFACSLDNGVYTGCASPTNYSDLSKGSHTFRVRAMDSRGLVDLSPATVTWTVSAGQVDAVITGQPANPTTERTATFTFNGSADVARFECSLDDGAYSPCTSPASFSALSYGEHTFRVRAVNSTNEVGAAAQYTWTVQNRVPVANDLRVTVAHNQATALTLTATDDDPLVYTLVTPPAYGVLTGLAPNLSYTPETNYSGPDHFTFKASDGLAESNVATVTLTVAQAPPDNGETQTHLLYLPVIRSMP